MTMTTTMLMMSKKPMIIVMRWCWWRCKQRVERLSLLEVVTGTSSVSLSVSSSEAELQYLWLSLNEFITHKESVLVTSMRQKTREREEEEKRRRGSEREFISFVIPDWLAFLALTSSSLFSLPRDSPLKGIFPSGLPFFFFFLCLMLLQSMMVLPFYCVCTSLSQTFDLCILVFFFLRSLALCSLFSFFFLEILYVWQLLSVKLDSYCEFQWKYFRVRESSSSFVSLLFFWLSSQWMSLNFHPPLFSSFPVHLPPMVM